MLAIVLKRVDFREKDQMITLFTLEKGKITVLARGSKKIISKNSAYLEPFFLIEMDLIVGKDNNYLTQVYGIKSFRNIRSDLSKIMQAVNVINLLDKILVNNIVESNMFYLLNEWLIFLDETKEESSSFYFIFLCKFLKASGINPILDYCAKCQDLKFLQDNNVNKFFSHEDGGVVCLKCSNKTIENKFIKLSSDDINYFNLFIDKDFNNCPDEISNNLKNIVFKFIEYHISVVLQ